MALRRLLYQAYWAVERVIAPGLAYSQDHYEQALTPYVTPQVAWLDVGCGHQILPSWRHRQERMLASSCRRLVGVDYDLASLRKHRTIRLRVRAHGSDLPFPTGSFDLVTENMVVEHLSNPAEGVKEIARVLKPSGAFLFHTPNAHSYTTWIARHIPHAFKPALVRLLEGRKEEDLFPTFYRANTVTEIERLAAAAGLEIERFDLVCTTAGFAMFLPLAVFELLWLRLLLMHRRFESLRTNIICALRKPKP